MKQIFACATMIAVFSALGFAQTGNAAALAQVKTVYLLPMSHGMDQYLAHALTHAGLVQVVTDPAKADAVLTDHLGAAFEASMKDLYPEAKPVVQPKSDDAQDEAADAPDKSTEHGDVKTTSSDRPPVPSRNRGMIFLVKRASSEVLWSAYHDPSIRRPKDLNRVGKKLSGSLKKAMNPVSPTVPAGK